MGCQKSSVARTALKFDSSSKPEDTKVTLLPNRRYIEHLSGIPLSMMFPSSFCTAFHSVSGKGYTEVAIAFLSSFHGMEFINYCSSNT
eukprot:IDg20969t1